MACGDQRGGPVLDSLRLWILWQLTLTAFLVAVLVILKTYAASTFFSFWMRAWILFGISLGCAWAGLSVDLPAGKWTLIALSLLATYLQAAFLFLAALSLRRGTPGADLRERCIVGAALVAGLVFMSAFLARESVNLSFSIRSVARSAVLAAVYAYAAAAFRASRRLRAYRGATFVGWCFIAYAAVQSIEAANAVLVVAVGKYLPFMQNLFLLDGACEGLMTASMVLLLVERSRQFHQRLELFEHIVPTCAVCGAVRDDARSGRGKGGWMPLEDFVRKYSEARFSHGLCPRCLEVQLEAARRMKSNLSA